MKKDKSNSDLTKTVNIQILKSELDEAIEKKINYFWKKSKN